MPERDLKLVRTLELSFLQFLRRVLPKRKTAVEPPRLPAGLRVYAIGDVHGRADLLSRAIDAINAHVERSPAMESICVFLGDYVDRGPDSRAVLDLLTDGILPMRVVSLRGNHEHMLLSFLTDPTTGASWRAAGGLETLHSYGLDVRKFRAGEQLDEMAERFRVEIPRSHLRFILQTELSITLGDYFFCHAGVRPKVSLEQQSAHDLLWIRDEFLSSKLHHGKMVVHGHTPVLKPEVKQNRINIDTGAYVSGRLTTLILENERQEFLST